MTKRKPGFVETKYDALTYKINGLAMQVHNELKPGHREKLYQLFNHRYNAELPTVITSASTPDEIDARLRARMDDRRLCIRKLINAPSYRGSRKR